MTNVSHKGRRKEGVLRKRGQGKLLRQFNLEGVMILAREGVYRKSYKESREQWSYGQIRRQLGVPQKEVCAKFWFHCVTWSMADWRPFSK
jgi:hypothetical protein